MESHARPARAAFARSHPALAQSPTCAANRSTSQHAVLIPLVLAVILAVITLLLRAGVAPLVLVATPR
jgi:hypothetical protein